MKSAAKQLLGCLAACVLFSVLSITALGQTFTATLTGTIVDPNGAAVAGVKVTVTNQGTRLAYPTQTDAAGLYTIPFLPVGNYVIIAEATGFKRLVSAPIKLEVNQTARLDLTMQLGEVTQEVIVNEVAPILQTENVTVGQVITGNTTVNLPLNGRNFQQLTLLVPGAVTPNPGAFTGAGMGAQGRPYVNGNREQGNAFLLDGISVDETIDNRIGYKPNVDAIAEFKVETSNSSAEFGNVAGATVNAILKSGTNAFHGNAFEFIRNDVLDANSWLNNHTLDPNTGEASKKRKLRQNIFGGTLGGPIIKNKLFFFGDYQGLLNRTGGSAVRSVAPAAWRTGNISSITGSCVTDRATNTCYPSTQVPVLNPVARALFADRTLYPLPTGPGDRDNYLSSDSRSIDGHQFDVRIDTRLSASDNVSGRFSLANYTDQPLKLALPTDVGTNNFSRPRSVVLNWTRTISPRIINEARVGLNRAVFFSEIADLNNLGNANARLGIPGTQVVPGLSELRLGNGLNNIGSIAITEDNVTNTFHYGDNLTINQGRHFMKLGGQWQRYQQNRFYTGNNGLLGYFSYSGGTFSSQGFADFLLDQVNQKGIGNTGGTNPGTWGHRQNRIGLFFQDDFKVRNNFSLNLGTRWEYTSPVYEVRDRQANFDLRTGRELFAGRDGNSRALYEPFHKAFEPRIGLAWTPARFKDKLVVRAGYGITQYMEGTGSNLRLPLNFPFFSEADTSFDLSSGPGRIATGFTDLIGATTPSGLIRIWNPDLRPQFTQQWNLTLEYQVTGNTSISAAYVGHKATHLVAPEDFNQPLPGVGPASSWVEAQLRRPLYSAQPRVTAVSGTDSPGVSNYEGLQMGVRRRLARGFEFLGSYTWSKTLTDNIGYYGAGSCNDGDCVGGLVFYQGNYYNRRADYGRAFFDATHNFSFSGTYDLPFGKGRTFGAGWKPVLNGLLGGWGLSSIVSIHSGFPMTIRAADQSLQSPRGGGRPNLAAGQSLRAGDGLNERYLNPNAFTLPALGTFGNAGIGIVEAPGYSNWDFSVGKKFSIKEGKYFDFRAEFFNFTNHPSFAPPAVDWSSSNNFGRITRTVSSPRNMEFVLKFFF
ncbi:MAG TPA: TonB-dependent receptor [Blastocatellia bacterium]|nr:TonB-dependent receptor [Blastocatellia bacterium]